MTSLSSMTSSTGTVGERRAAATAPRPRTIDTIARRGLLAALGRIRVGRVTVADGAEQWTFGPGGAEGLEARLTIESPRAWSSIALGGALGAGEAFQDGLWTCDDPTALVRLLVRNRDAMEAVDGKLSALLAPVRRLAYILQRNTRTGSRRNIAAHYDLSNDLFRLFLDESMTYSSAVFENGASTLEEGQREKLDRLCRKLELTADDHLLEIGTGWGSMSMHAAATYGCRVTTTTISREQATLARQRIAEAGLADRITVIERDYRDLDGVYDKIVSIEMVEAVGDEFLSEYFESCSRLLKPDGQMALQAIVIRDQHHRRAARRRDWLKKHIFPGSCLLSVESIARSVREGSDMVVNHMEDFGPHYATTLAMWRDRFDARLTEVRELGFDDRFVRTWHWYLAYCEGAFLERHCSVVQALLTKPLAHRAPHAEVARAC